MIFVIFQPRSSSVVPFNRSANTSNLRYTWRLLPLLAKSNDSILHLTNAEHIMLQGTNRAVILVLTRQALLIVNVAEDSVEKMFTLKDLVVADHPSDASMLRVYSPSTPPQPVRKISPMEQIEVI